MLKRKAIYILTAVFLACMLSAAVFSVQVFAASSLPADAISIEDNFEEDSVLVILEPESSEFRDIPQNIGAQLYELGASSVSNLTALPESYLRADGSFSEEKAPGLYHHYSRVDFQQILKVTLAQKGKQQVLDAVAAISEIEGVESAEPNMIYEAEYTNDTYSTAQWVLYSKKWGILA